MTSFVPATKDLQRQWRSRLFFHLDGLALSGVVPVLDVSGVLEEVLQTGGDVDELASLFGANPGYLNVGLRMLCSQGILDAHYGEDKVTYVPHKDADVAHWARDRHLYALGRSWLEHSVGMWNRPQEPLSAEALSVMRALLGAVMSGGGLADHTAGQTLSLEQRLRVHLEGALVAPWLVMLGTAFGTEAMTSWDDVSRASAQLHPQLQEAWSEVMHALGWSDSQVGAFFLQRAAAYGVTTSYTQTFLWAKELLLGEGSWLWRTEPGEAEIHVDRTLNVWGSGGAHKAYFSHLDEVIKDVFNAPLEEQPLGLCDMGCGNGALLLHMREVIESDTLRGQHLDTHPLMLVGADFNQEALVATADHFRQKGVKGHFIWGDIGDPDRLALDLYELHGVRLGDLMSVRSFLDHNRVYNPPIIDRPEAPVSSGAFAFRGKRLKLRNVEQSLKEHLMKWSPYVAQHGLLMIELHTVAPENARLMQGKLPATAYDATHGFSDQYILEIPVFDAMAAEAGLEMQTEHSRTFPSSLPATVSLRFFRA